MKSKTDAKELQPHELALIFPAMSDEDYTQLRENIRVNGQRDSITTYQKKVLDGVHRLRACLEEGIEPRFEEFRGPGSALSFVIDKNLHRRHLDESQRAMVATELKAIFAKEAKANMKRGREGLANLPPVRSRERAAKLTNVSSRSVGLADVVRERGTPELAEAVRRGRVAVSAAATVAKLPPEEQAKVVAKGPLAVRATAAEMRRTKKKEPPVDRRAVMAEPASTKATRRAPKPADDRSADEQWLESFALRAKLADPRVFDAQARFHRLTLEAMDMIIRDYPEVYKSLSSRHYVGSPTPLLVGFVTPVSPPDTWTLCDHCEGSGRQEREACMWCRGDGFRIPDPDTIA